MDDMQLEYSIEEFDISTDEVIAMDHGFRIMQVLQAIKFEDGTYHAIAFVERIVE